MEIFCQKYCWELSDSMLDTRLLTDHTLNTKAKISRYKIFNCNFKMILTPMCHNVGARPKQSRDCQRSRESGSSAVVPVDNCKDISSVRNKQTNKQI